MSSGKCRSEKNKGTRKARICIELKRSSYMHCITYHILSSNPSLIKGLSLDSIIFLSTPPKLLASIDGKLCCVFRFKGMQPPSTPFGIASHNDDGVQRSSKVFFGQLCHFLERSRSNGLCWCAQSGQCHDQGPVRVEKCRVYWVLRHGGVGRGCSGRGFFTLFDRGMALIFCVEDLFNRSGRVHEPWRLIPKDTPVFPNKVSNVKVTIINLSTRQKTHLIMSSSLCSLTLMSNNIQVCMPNLRFSSNRSYQLPGFHMSV